MAGNFDITVFIRYLVRPMATVSKAKRRTTEALRRAIRGIEEARSPSRPHLPLGVPEIDRALPGGGLRLGCIHEVVGDEAATGFCAVLLARAGGGGGDSGERGGSLLWLARGDDLYAPGLVRYGIGAGRLLVVSGLHRQADMLWAMEEALRCRALAGVVAEAEAIGLTAGRRLMLAAEGTGVLGLVLSRGGGGRGRGGAGVAAAVSRWRVTAVPGVEMAGKAGSSCRMPDDREQPETDGARWRVEVLHCRGGRPSEWITAWGDDGWSVPVTPRDDASCRQKIAGVLVTGTGAGSLARTMPACDAREPTAGQRPITTSYSDRSLSE